MKKIKREFSDGATHQIKQKRKMREEFSCLCDREREMEHMHAYKKHVRQILDRLTNYYRYYNDDDAADD